MIKNLVYILLILFLSACSQNYGKGSSFLFIYNPGYHVKKLKAENEYKIRYTGHIPDSMLLVTDYAFLSASETTLEKGFTHFSILSIKKIYASSNSTRNYAKPPGSAGYPTPNTPSPNQCIIKIKLLNTDDFNPDELFAIDANDAVVFIRGRYGEVNK